jgi:hypothetical protein
MGGGLYSAHSHTLRATAAGYATKSAHEIFKRRNLNSLMNPNGVTIRESRDSKEHPNSMAIIIGLDVTGSMGSVPHHLVKDGMPTIMEKIMKGGMKDPQVLFLGIGDHECDDAPLQVSQFESSDELLDKWLTEVYLEGGGGGNAGESYLLAWYFAGYHTSIDCQEKRGQKGFLFTIGDEPPLRSVPKDTMKDIMGPGEYQNYTLASLLDKAKEKYNVFHIHIMETTAGRRKTSIDPWKELLGDNLLPVQSYQEVPDAIADAINRCSQMGVVISSVTPSKVEHTNLL